MNLTSWYKDTCTIQVQTGVDDQGDPTWGSKQTLKCRVERHAITKEKFQREEREVLARISVPLELNERQNVRVWLSEFDDTVDEESREGHSMQPVRDKWNRFVHTVMWV